MGGCLCRTFCCDCSLFEPRDDWNIENEAQDGEKGAGWIYKKAKGSDLVWSKRYFVLTGEKLFYFTDRNRVVKKGEIVLAGATAVECSHRADTKKIFYFNITHPQCGSREFYAKTRNRRAQWINKINEISNELSHRAIFGKLFKQGGMSKNVWQERWCICTGTTIDYFDSPTDNQSKGSLCKFLRTLFKVFSFNKLYLFFFFLFLKDIVGASVRPLAIKEKYCFEISTAQPGKKGNKKYVFASLNEAERDTWIERLIKLSTGDFSSPQFSQANVAISTDSGSVNPIHAAIAAAALEGGEIDPANPDGGIALQKMSTTSRGSIVPQEMSGYLMKKSPAMMKGWQKRYFKTQTNGDISYFKSVSYFL
jgi:hypothetical protein